MDASTRSFHVYGKTQSGASVLNSKRGALSSSARQLLILMDGQRSLGDLSRIFGDDALNRSLALLESQGYVQLVRNVPPTQDSPIDLGASTPQEMPVTRTDAAPRRRSAAAPIALGALVAIAGIIWPFLRDAVEKDGAQVPASPVANPTPAPGTGNPVADRLAVRPAPKLAVPPSAASRKTAVPPAVAGELLVPAPASVLHVRNQVTPEIPKHAKELGITTGNVVVLLHISPTGAVERVELVSATPPEVYDEDMQQAFEKWTFDPLGVPGRMTVQVDIRPPE